VIVTPEVELELYQAVMRRIEALMGAQPGTSEGAELDFLVTVAESYEARALPPAKPREPDWVDADLADDAPQSPAHPTPIENKGASQ
jgi:hypothetical protein